MSENLFLVSNKDARRNYKLQQSEARKKAKENDLKMTKCELYNDNFQNYKRYNIPKAQLVIADLPYNLGNNAFASARAWYNNGRFNEGYSKNAGTQFFKTDLNFNIAEFFHFCSKLVKEGTKEPLSAGCMIVFCSFQQTQLVLYYAQKHGFNHNIPLVFRKKTSAQVLKANMRIVGCCEYGFILYKDTLPKFRNYGKMILNCFDWNCGKSIKIPKIHPTQKPYGLLQTLISLFTDEGDVVIDPCAGSAVALLAGANIKRNCYGFEIEKEFYNKAKTQILSLQETFLF